MEENKVRVSIYNIFAMAVNQNYVKQLRDYRKYNHEPTCHDREVTINDMYNLVSTITKNLHEYGEQGKYVFELLAFKDLKGAYDDYFAIKYDERGMVFEAKDEFDRDLRLFYKEYYDQDLEEVADCSDGIDELLGIFPIDETKAFRDGVHEQIEIYYENGMDDNFPFVDVEDDAQ